MKKLILLITLGLILTPNVYAEDTVQVCSETEELLNASLMEDVNKMTAIYQERQPTYTEAKAFDNNCRLFNETWKRDRFGKLVKCQYTIGFTSGLTQSLLLPRPEIETSCSQNTRYLGYCDRTDRCQP